MSIEDGFWRRERNKQMLEVTNNTNIVKKEVPSEILQLKHIKGESIFITDPEGNKMEFRTTEDGARIAFTKDEVGRGIAIEERTNGTKLYHISSDSTGLPSSHELRTDDTEIIYFYDAKGILQHFVELKANGDRVSTIISENGSIYSVEQKQVGGIIFQAWVRENNDPREGMIWLHPDGEVSTHGDDGVIKQITRKFSKFLDGVGV
jgi:hypothetical protein